MTPNLTTRKLREHCGRTLAPDICREYNSRPRHFLAVRCGGVPWLNSSVARKGAFTPMSKRRRGFPSETRVKRGYRVVGGSKELIRETWSERPVPVRIREVVSRNVV